MSTDKSNNNNNNMETPPSSPSNGKGKNESLSEQGPPSLMESTSLSASTDTAHGPAGRAVGSMETSPNLTSSPVRGHIRVATPSTPVRMDEAYAGPPSHQGAPKPFSTPGRSSSGAAPPGPRPSGGYHLTSDLTPVISNAAGVYVDSIASQGSKPGMPGLSASGEGGFAIVTPGGAMIGPRASRGRLSSGAAAALGGGVDSAGGLRQRPQQRRPFPPPRAGLPPIRSTGVEGGAPAGAAGAASIMRMPSAASSDSSQLRISPSTPSNDTPRSLAGGSEENDGLGGLLGEGLSMPSYELEDSSVDTSGSGRNAKRSTGAAASIFKTNDQPGLAPIELRPDRKFFSFQGSSQYKQAVGEDDDVEGKEEEGEPMRMETIPDGRQPSLQHEQQYQPFLRGQHGVKEMADAEELDAIFKAPRQPQVVTPSAPAAGSVMMVGGPQQQLSREPQPLLSSMAREEMGASIDENAPTDSDHPAISRPYPVDDRQFSIPSIRLANHVNSMSRSGGYPFDKNYSYQSEYTYEDDVSLEESYYSFLADDDDASLSSRGSVDTSTRKRRISLHKIHLKRMASAGSATNEQGVATEVQVPLTIHSQDNGGGTAIVSPPPAIAPSNSFIEKVKGISIDSAFKAGADAANEESLLEPPPLPRRANTFDSETPPIQSVDATAPSQVDDDAVDGSRRRRRQRGSRRRRKEGAAAQWLADLQSKSITGGGSDVLIVEAASSKFLQGDGVSGGERVGIEALGMPHPLCRSSTIEAGPFVRRSGEVALTSSGSGD